MEKMMRKETNYIKSRGRSGLSPLGDNSNGFPLRSFQESRAHAKYSYQNKIKSSQKSQRAIVYEV